MARAQNCTGSLDLCAEMGAAGRFSHVFLLAPSLLARHRRSAPKRYRRTALSGSSSAKAVIAANLN
jgi:hypothetical protein